MIEGVTHVSIDPNWVIAILTAGTAGVGAAGWYRRATAKRKRRQVEYRTLWRDFYGQPELRDEAGVVYQEAEQGIYQRVEALEGAFYGHSSHPPHPGRRREDGRAP